MRSILTVPSSASEMTKPLGYSAVSSSARTANQSRLLAVYGVWQRDDDSGGEVRHVIAKRLVDLTDLLGELATTSRDFH